MTVTSREIVERALWAGRDLDVEALVALMAPDGYIEWPYRPPGAPARVQGHAEIRAHLTRVAEGFIRFDDYRNVVIHETTDPDAVIVEYDVHATVLTTGAALDQSVIAVFRLENGQIRAYRDYINPLPLLDAYGETRSQ
jgi:ketosteroid isomerase-like protein